MHELFQPCIYLFSWMALLISVNYVTSLTRDTSTAIPNRSYLFVGEDLQVTCTLDDELLKMYTAHNINFSVQDLQKTGSAQRCFNMSHVTVMNLTTSWLIVQNVTTDDAGRYRCFIGNNYCQTALNDSILQDDIFAEDVTIEYAPQNVTNFNCVVYNWDESMTCTWQHPVDYVYKSQTQVNSMYADTSSQPVVVYECPEPSYNGCHWNAESFATLNYYVIGVDVLNLVMSSTASKIFVVNTLNIVKPADVEELSSDVNVEEPVCIVLSWTHSRLHREKIFRIKHKQIQDTVFSILADNIINTNFTTCGYQPYTHHRFSLECYPTSSWSGFWSDPVYTDIWTPTTAPGWGPQITNGSFTTSECVDGLRSVTIMWKDVMKSSQNGIIDSYIIKNKKIITQVNAQMYSTNVLLPCFATTELKIFAHNQAGNSLQPSILIIPPVTYSVSKTIKDSFSVEITSKVNSSWHKDSLRASWDTDDVRDYLNYSIFWCEGYPEQICQGQVSWLTVPGSQTYLEIPVPVSRVNKYRFGISVTDTQSEISSGIFWTECLFIRKPSYLPHVKGMKVQSSVEKVWVTWNLLHCTYESKAKVTGYKVKWCQEARYNDSSSVVVSASEFAYLIPSLTADVPYMFTVQALSHETEGDEVTPWTSTILLASGSRLWLWILFALVSIMMLFCAAYYMCKKFKTRGLVFKDLKTDLLNWNEVTTQTTNFHSSTV